jgi:hypothetical protein
MDAVLEQMAMQKQTSILPTILVLAFVAGTIVLILMMTTGWNPFSILFGAVDQGAKTAKKIIDSAKSKYDSSKGACGSSSVGGKNEKVPCLDAQIAFCSSGGMNNNGGGQNTACFTNRGVPLCSENMQCVQNGQTVPCPCYPNSVDCSVFGTYDSKWGRCGTVRQGGDKCKRNCCQTQWDTTCKNAIYVFGNKTQCMQDRGCSPILNLSKQY